MSSIAVDYAAEQDPKLMIARSFFLGILLWIGSIPLPALAAGDAVLRGIDLAAPNAQGARITLNLSSSTTYKLFTLDKPTRIVLDLQRTRLAPGARLAAGDGLISAIRTGIQPGGVLRVVLQLTSGVKAKALWAEGVDDNAHQLVVNLGDIDAPNALTAQPTQATTQAMTQATAKVKVKKVPVTAEVAGAGMSPATAQVAAEVMESADDEPRPVRALHAPADSDRPVIVAVDAGHGGQDPGATGRNGTHEKDVVLAIARALAKRIEAEPGMHAVLTRDRDEFLPLRERIGRARAARADLFVSVHADSIRNPEVSGSSVYVLSERGATDESARWLAERENAADLIGGVSLVDKDDTLASVLLDLSNSANISASMGAAKRVLDALNIVGEVRKPAVQQAGFVVLKSPDIPSMLVETAYISNPKEERRLRTELHQGKLANAIFSGLRAYFEQSPPPGTRFAMARRVASSGGSMVLASPSTGAQ